MLICTVTEAFFIQVHLNTYNFNQSCQIFNVYDASEKSMKLAVLFCNFWKYWNQDFERDKYSILRTFIMLISFFPQNIIRKDHKI